MLKIIIVDDEMLVRANVKLLINWTCGDFEFCGEAVNGIDALKLVRNVSPDIIISDIRMPEMNGLDLSKQIHDKYPHIKMIILSNFDDFDYVKGALQNGAVDYILKHKLNKDILEEVLNKAKRAIFEESSKEPDTQKKITKNLLSLKTNFLRLLLTGFYTNIDEIKGNFLLYDIKLELNNLVPIALSIDNYSSSIHNGGLKDTNLLEFAVINIIEDILDDYGNGTVCHISNERFSILLSFSKLRSNAAINSNIDLVLGRIRTALHKFMNISVSFSIGKLCEKINDIPQNFDTASTKMKLKFYYGKNCTLRDTGIVDLKNSLAGLDSDIEKQLIKNIKLNNLEEVNLLINDIFAYINREKLNAVSSYLIFTDLLGLINRICKERNIDLATIYLNQFSPHELLLKLETLEDIKQWFLTLFKRLYNCIVNVPYIEYSKYVQSALSFISKHFSDDISQQNVADKIGISTVYLSKLFREELGIGFSEYLTNLRLEKAQVLLEEDRLDIREIISVCGFNDYTYFFKVFKKKIGITPKEFINRENKLT